MTARHRQFAWGTLAGLLLLLFFAGGWLRQSPPRLLKAHVGLPPGQSVPLGREIVSGYQVETTWRQRPSGELRLALPEGLAPGPGAGIRLRTIGWGICRWWVHLPLRPHRSGTFAGGTLDIPCGTATLTLELPAVTVVADVPDDPAPEPAPVPEPLPGKPWLGWLLTLAAFLLLWRFHKGRKSISSTPSPSLADDTMEELRNRVETPDEAFFGRLCDLVAVHLQTAHAIPATGLTLREQAAWLSQTRHLPARLAEPLLELWRTAERVRFAGQLPTVEQARAAFRATEALLARNRGGRA